MSAEKVYAFYQALHAAAGEASVDSRQAGLGGRLLLYESLDGGGRTAALAGNIAGLATLGIDGNNASLKQAARDGVCDFLVNTLDEALRILKNELRKKQGVSVCLQQDFAIAIAEIVDRGVQPDFLAVKTSNDSQPAEIPSVVAVLRDRGALDITDLHMHIGDVGGAMGVAWTALAAPALWLPKIDAVAAGVIDPADEPGQRWLLFASRYLGRLSGGTHYMRMAAAQATEFRRRLQENVASGGIGCAIRLVTDGLENSISEIRMEN